MGKNIEITKNRDIGMQNPKKKEENSEKKSHNFFLTSNKKKKDKVHLTRQTTTLMTIYLPKPSIVTIYPLKQCTPPILAK
jgi:hypothetical protein